MRQLMLGAAARLSWDGEIAIYQVLPHGGFDIGDRVGLAKPVQFEAHDWEKLHDMEREPICSISKASAQALLDDLYRLGLRPSERSDADKGTIAAMERHVADLRDIAFAALEIKKP